MAKRIPLREYRNTLPCWLFVPYLTVLYRTLPYDAIPYRTKPYHTLPYPTIPYHTIPCHTIQYHTVPYHADTSHVAALVDRRCLTGMVLVLLHAGGAVSTRRATVWQT